MTITTKFNVEDTVYFIYGGFIYKDVIKEIKIYSNWENVISYNLTNIKHGSLYLDESELYGSLKELEEAVIGRFRQILNDFKDES